MLSAEELIFNEDIESTFTKFTSIVALISVER